MTIKIIKIDGEFAIVGLENRERKICPVEIFSAEAKDGDVYNIIREYHKHP